MQLTGLDRTKFSLIWQAHDLQQVTGIYVKNMAEVIVLSGF